MAGIFQLGGYFMGFDMNPTGAQTFDSSVSGSGNSTTPFGFGFSWQFSTNNGPIKNLGVNLTDLIVGARIFTALPATNAILFVFYDVTAAAAQVTLRLFSDGSLRFYLGNGTGTPIGAASATGLVSASTWVHFEAKVKIAAAGAGSVELRINGNATPVITQGSVTTQSTANTWVNAVQLDAPNGNINWDDWYMLDKTGASPLDTYLGTVQVREDAPSANSAVGGRNAFTPTNPTNVNYTNVGNIPAVATKYNADSTPGDYDMFQFPALPSNVATVLAVNVVALLLLDSAGARTVELNTYSNGTDSATAAFTPGTTAAYSTQVSTLDPHTGVAWTVANAGAAELGVKVQT